VTDVANLAGLWAHVIDRSAGLGVPAGSVAPRLMTMCSDAGLATDGHVQLASTQPAAGGSLGDDYEEDLTEEQRRRLGAFYTPPAVAGGLIEMAFDGWKRTAVPVRVLDPSCGAGAFLVAAADVLLARGHSAIDILDRLYGVDVDPTALAVAEATVRLWAVSHGVEVGGDDPQGPHLRNTNYLTQPDRGLGAFDLIVGNPPFLNQLESATARTPEEVRTVKERFGRAAFGYGDTSALFLLAALDDLVDGGRVVLVQPDSVVSAAGPAAIRAELLERAALVSMWDADARIFDASVFVCAPVLERGAVTTEIVRRRGPDFDHLPSADWTDGPPVSWAGLLAGNGAPDVVFGDSETLASIATATAGFRDEFYGLAAHVIEAADAVGADDVIVSVGVTRGGQNAARVPHAALVTAGLIEPLECRWGTSEARFAGRKFREPVVDQPSLASANPRLAGWLQNRLVTKVMVATQTKVIECITDHEGALVPSVPVISVECAPDMVDHIAAALCAPPVSAWAMGRAAGAAMSKNALKLSARQLLTVPLPTDSRAWDEGAAMVRAITGVGLGTRTEAERNKLLITLGQVMLRAYALDENHPSLAWWQARLVARRLPRAVGPA